MTNYINYINVLKSYYVMYDGKISKGQSATPVFFFTLRFIYHMLFLRKRYGYFVYGLGVGLLLFS